MKNYKFGGQDIAMAFPPSKEQNAIAEALINTAQNLLIDAKAGAGKTTTIQLLIKLVLLINPNATILLIAFNKVIVEELKERIKDHRVEIRTSHSLGMKILNDRRYRKGDRRVTLNGDKAADALKVLVKLWEYDLDTEDDTDKMKAILKLSNLARLNLVSKADQIKELADRHGIDCFEDIPTGTTELIRTLNRDTRTIDFTDMIYQTHLLREQIKFPQYDYVFIDECQDLNAAQQFLMKSCVKRNGGRFIAVGDPSQAIYGFAGADAESFAKLAATENTVTLPLNECYRCSKSIIAYVQKKTGSTIKAFEGKQQGPEPTTASVKDLRDGDFVMCRNTLPLIKLCYHLISKGVAANIRGRDIGVTLVNLVKRSKRKSLEGLYNWLEKEADRKYKQIRKANPHFEDSDIKEMGSFQMMMEKHQIIKIIAESKKAIIDTDDLCRAISALFTDAKNGGVLLSTVHKAKGLEFKRCFVLEPELMPSKHAKQEWQKIQENNIEYVCYTRAEEELYFIADYDSKNGHDESWKEQTQHESPDQKNIDEGIRTSIYDNKAFDKLEQSGQVAH